jgi:adenosylmethionine-8-amino-7-oxononanoate aminotransferase
MAMLVGGLAGLRRGFGLFVQGILHAPFPDYYDAEPGDTPDRVDERRLQALDDIVRYQSSGEICALITEPYQDARG